MPLKGKSVRKDASEFRKGNTFERTKEKFGIRTAVRQSYAAAHSAKRKKQRMKRRRSRRGTSRSR